MIARRAWEGLGGAATETGSASGSGGGIRSAPVERRPITCWSSPQPIGQEPRSPAHRRDREGLLRRDPLQAEAHKLLSREHFSVDGTLLEAAAALKSLRPIEENEENASPPPSGGSRNPDVDFHGQRRGNATHRSATDPEARLARKGAGKEASRSTRATA